MLPQGKASEGVSAHLQSCYQRRNYQTGPTQTLRLVILLLPSIYPSRIRVAPSKMVHHCLRMLLKQTAETATECPPHGARLQRCLLSTHNPINQLLPLPLRAPKKQNKTATTSAPHRGAAERTLRMLAARPSSLAGILQAGAASQLSTRATATLGYTTTGSWPEHDATSSGHPWTPPKPCSPPWRKAFCFNLAVANKTACARATWWRIDWLK